MIVRGGKRFFVPSVAFTGFQDHAVGELYDQIIPYLAHLPIFTGPIKVETIFDIPGKTRVDGDNLHTSILDVLQTAQIIDDDKHVYKGSYLKRMGAPVWKVTIRIDEI
jgi:Holliday junction resolvase RusA-like endonuclease